MKHWKMYIPRSHGCQGCVLFRQYRASLGPHGLLFASQVLLFKNENAGQGQSDIIPGLERLERYLKLFLDSLSLAVILVGHDERISFASSGIKDILGVPPEALISQPVREVLQRFGIDPHFALDDATRGAKNRFVNVPVHVDGVEKLVTMVTTGVTMPHWAGHGTDVPETYGHIIILEDLREARAQEERLERIERLATVGELAAAIAHEVRNPLTVVKGAVSLLPQRLDDPDFLGKFQGLVTQELDRIDRTIDSLLNFARFSQPKMARINVILSSSVRAT